MECLLLARLGHLVIDRGYGFGNVRGEKRIQVVN